MISKFHLRSLELRFPLAYKEYTEVGGTDEWSNLCDWIKYKGYDENRYAISLKRINNDLRLSV